MRNIKLRIFEYHAIMRKQLFTIPLRLKKMFKQYVQ